MSAELKMDGLKKFMKALKSKAPEIRVGILGDIQRKDGSANNATVGAMHEFGTSTLPVRSFLRVPITENLDKALQTAGFFNKDDLTKTINQGSLSAWSKKVALVAEDIVLGAFDTGGYGRWIPSDMDHKKVKQTLVETQQLRNSITSEVKE